MAFLSAFLLSNTGMAMVGGAFSWLVAKVIKKKPRVQMILEEYEGSIISAVKLSEKAINDDTENKSMRRLNFALTYVLQAYELRTGKVASEVVKAEFAENINKVHAVLNN